MAAKKGDAPAVSHVETDAGDHAIGIEYEGVFVPFASVSAARFGQLLEHAHNVAGDGGGDSDEEVSE